MTQRRDLANRSAISDRFAAHRLNYCISEDIESATDLTPSQTLAAIDVHFPKAGTTAIVNQEAVKAFQSEHRTLYELSANAGAVRVMADAGGNIRQFTEELGAMLFAHKLGARRQSIVSGHTEAQWST